MSTCDAVQLQPLLLADIVVQPAALACARSFAVAMKIPWGSSELSAGVGRYQAGAAHFSQPALMGASLAAHLALAVEQIKPGGHHDRGARDRPVVGHVAEHQVAEGDHPDDLGVDERRRAPRPAPGGGRRSADSARGCRTRRSPPSAPHRPKSRGGVQTNGSDRQHHDAPTRLE